MRTRRSKTLALTTMTSEATARKAQEDAHMERLAQRRQKRQHNKKKAEDDQRLKDRQLPATKKNEKPSMSYTSRMLAKDAREQAEQELKQSGKQPPYSTIHCLSRKTISQRARAKARRHLFKLGKKWKRKRDDNAISGCLGLEGWMIWSQRENKYEIRKSKLKLKLSNAVLVDDGFQRWRLKRSIDANESMWREWQKYNRCFYPHGVVSNRFYWGEIQLHEKLAAVAIETEPAPNPDGNNPTVLLAHKRTNEEILSNRIIEYGAICRRAKL